MGYNGHGVNRGTNRKHPLYSVYWNMLGRCVNPKRHNFKNYGGRGIKVCERWSGKDGFAYFVHDMPMRPKGYQLDRIDVNGDYCPQNCRWVDIYTQMGNQTTNNPVPGVGWHSQRKKWRARIKIKGKEKSLGLFNSYDEAVNARKLAFSRICF